MDKEKISLISNILMTMCLRAESENDISLGPCHYNEDCKCLFTKRKMCGYVSAKDWKDWFENKK